MSLTDDAIRAETAQILAGLIKRVTTYPGDGRSAEAEVVAKVGDLMSFAINDNAAHGAAHREFRTGGCGDRI